MHLKLKETSYHDTYLPPWFNILKTCGKSKQATKACSLKIKKMCWKTVFALMSHEYTPHPTRQLHSFVNLNQFSHFRHSSHSKSSWNTNIPAYDSSFKNFLTLWALSHESSGVICPSVPANTSRLALHFGIEIYIYKSAHEPITPVVFFLHQVLESLWVGLTWLGRDVVVWMVTI